ncbi:MAG TPA: hypothetical protein VKY32_03040 [Flavobacterium sp.]|nr:hypothetical protein [Flavobacterium sp.]
MRTKAFIRQNDVYINNNLSFSIHHSSIWFGREKCKLLDAFGNILLEFKIKHCFLKPTQITFISNGINPKYRFYNSKNELYWQTENTKYHIQQKRFLNQITFLKNNKEIGTMDKNSFRVSYADYKSFTFSTKDNEEVELCLLLYVIHQCYFPVDG